MKTPEEMILILEQLIQLDNQEPEDMNNFMQDLFYYQSLIKGNTH